MAAEAARTDDVRGEPRRRRCVYSVTSRRAGGRRLTGSPDRSAAAGVRRRVVGDEQVHDPRQLAAVAVHRVADERQRPQPGSAAGQHAASQRLQPIVLEVEMAQRRRAAERSVGKVRQPISGELEPLETAQTDERARPDVLDGVVVETKRRQVAERREEVVRYEADDVIVEGERLESGEAVESAVVEELDGVAVEAEHLKVLHVGERLAQDGLDTVLADMQHLMHQTDNVGNAILNNNFL